MNSQLKNSACRKGCQCWHQRVRFALQKKCLTWTSHKPISVRSMLPLAVLSSSSRTLSGRCWLIRHPWPHKPLSSFFHIPFDRCWSIHHPRLELILSFAHIPSDRYWSIDPKVEPLVCHSRLTNPWHFVGFLFSHTPIGHLGLNHLGVGLRVSCVRTQPKCYWNRRCLHQTLIPSLPQ